MKKLFLFYFLIVLVSNTSLADDAVTKLKSYVANKLKGQVIELVEFQKTNGEVYELFGHVFYTFKVNITIKFNADGWLKGNSLEGYWRNDLYVYPSKPDLYKYGQQYTYTTKMYPKGTILKLGCEATMINSDNGFKVDEFSVKTISKLGFSKTQN